MPTGSLQAEAGSRTRGRIPWRAAHTSRRRPRKTHIARSSRPAEADHDVQPPSEHDVDQDLDTEIIHPFECALGQENHDQDRIDDHEAHREGREPVCERGLHGGNAGVPGRRTQGPARAPGRDHQRADELRRRDQRDHVSRSGKRVSSSSSLRMFCTVLKPISGRNRMKVITAGDGGAFQRAGDIDARVTGQGGLVAPPRSFTPSPLPAARAAPAAGRSA